VQRVLW